MGAGLCGVFTFNENGQRGCNPLPVDPPRPLRSEENSCVGLPPIQAPTG